MFGVFFEVTDVQNLFIENIKSVFLRRTEPLHNQNEHSLKTLAIRCVTGVATQCIWSLEATIWKPYQPILAPYVHTKCVCGYSVQKNNRISLQNPPLVLRYSFGPVNISAVNRINIRKGSTTYFRIIYSHLYSKMAQKYTAKVSFSYHYYE